MSRGKIYLKKILLMNFIKKNMITNAIPIMIYFSVILKVLLSIKNNDLNH